jgi:hypothetical protein
MAQRTIVQLVDDFDGQELRPGEGETVRITLDGASYELDLSAKNARKLRDDFGKWLSHARKASSGRRSGGRTAATSGTRRDAEGTGAIRDWAKAKGHEVSDRGRLPAEIVAAYEADR